MGRGSSSVKMRQRRRQSKKKARVAKSVEHTVKARRGK